MGNYDPSIQKLLYFNKKVTHIIDEWVKFQYRSSLFLICETVTLLCNKITNQRSFNNHMYSSFADIDFGYECNLISIQNWYKNQWKHSERTN